MADVQLDIRFRVELTQKEFSVVTRSLAGHELKAHDLVLARDLNKRLLEQRVAMLRDYAKQSARALEVAEEESEANDKRKTDS